ncbi:TUTLB-like protein, partial [Mya arenaria]
HPLSPYNLQHFKKATFDTIYIEWTPGLDGGLPQTFYVEYREVGASVWMKERVIAGHINYTIVGLNPETMYEIRVYSTNDIGRSNASEAITVTTLKRPETGGPPMVIITVLLVVVVVVVVVVVAVTIILVRKRKGGMPEYVSRLTTGLELQSMPNQEGTEDDNDGGKTNPTYEGCGDIQDKPYKTGSRVSQPQNKETGEVGEENDAVNKNKTDPYEHTETPQGENGQTTSYSFDTY